MSDRAEQYRAEHPLDPSVRIERFDESNVTGDDVLELWQREAGVVGDEAHRRLGEVLLVAVDNPTGALTGIFTAGLRHSPQLGIDMWYARAFVAPSGRSLSVASHLLDRGRMLLEERFVRGEDTRAAGLWLDVENEGLKRSQPDAEWPLGYTFIGQNQRGDHVRVYYFPGATIAPSATRAS